MSNSVYQGASAIRRQGYLFLFSCPGCSVIRERSLPRYFSGKSFLSAHQSCWFLDSWSEHLPWMDEGHLVVNVTSYAFQYAWGGIVYNPSGPPLETRDIWREDVRDKPIAVKKALALVNTLKAGKSVLSNCRVDAHVDCLALIQAWERQGGKSTQLNDALKLFSPRIFPSVCSSCPLVSTRLMLPLAFCLIRIACLPPNRGRS